MTQKQDTVQDQNGFRPKDGQLNQTSLLGLADPYAAFNPSEYLVGAGASHSVNHFGTAEERWSALQVRIPALLTSEISHAVMRNSLEDETANNLEVTKASAGMSAVERIDRLKRKRKLKQFVVLASFITLAIAFLGYAGLRFVLNRQQLAQRRESETKVLAENPIPAIPPDSKEKVIKPLVVGRDPKGSHNSPVMVLPKLTQQDTVENAPMEFTEENPFGNASKAPISKAPITVQSNEPRSDLPPAMSPSLALPTSSTMPPAGVPQPTMNPATVANSKAAWIAAMKSAREAVDKADFKTFHQKMELSLPLCMDEESREKHARLDQLGQLYEIFIKAVRDAKTKMGGAETLSVGKTLVSIVELKEDELIVRIKGNREHYAWDRLPPGIANAMADFSLSDQEPTDVAARAVYFSLSPAKNDLFAKKVKDWFEKTAGKGAVRKDLVQALTDIYE